MPVPVWPPAVTRMCGAHLQLKELKEELAMRDVLAGRSKVPYDDMDDSQLHELRTTMRQARPPPPLPALAYKPPQPARCLS